MKNCFFRKKLNKTFILFFVFIIALFQISYADIIRVSEDVNPNYQKDFNGDGKYVVVLDPGHGGSKKVAHRGIGFYDVNEQSIIYENDIDLKVATMVRDFLKEDGRLNVYMTRESDVDVSLADRGVIAKNLEADLMISIHFNDMPTYTQDTRAMGCEIWQSVIDMYKPYKLAEFIFKEFNKNHFLQVVRGLKERVSGDTYWNYEKNDAEDINTGYEADYYGVIKAGARNRVPTIIVEHAFFSNDNDFTMMQDENALREMASREAKAILNWFFINDFD